MLVSHGHWDHTDRRFFRSLEPETPVFVPSGTAALMRIKGVRSPVPVATWKSLRVSAAAVTAVPAAHLARTVGWVVQTGDACIYFAGDTYHRPFMEEIGRRFAIDAALMPVSTYRIPLTMGEKGAVKAARDLRAGVVIPIHLGVQPRSPLLRTRQSPEGFDKRLRDAGLRTRVVHLADGATWEVGKQIKPEIPDIIARAA